jgi:GGDEF domain-containing protein
MPQVKGIRSTPKPGVPILHEHVDDLRDILTRIALDIDSAVKEQRSDGSRLGPSRGVSCHSVRNPFERYTFQVENPVSRRLDIVLKHRSPDSQGKMRMRDRRNNANLVFYALSVVLVLDYLLNDPDSFYYKSEVQLFRSIDGEGHEPVYTVDVLDPQKVMRQAEQNELSPPDELDALGGEVSRDALTGLRNSFGLKEELRRHIEFYHENHKPFTMLALELHRFDAYVKANDQIEVERQLRNFATALTDTVREYADIPFRVQDHRFLMILRETTSQEAVPLLYRLNDRLSFEDSVLQRCHAAIVSFHRTWGAEKLLSTVDRSLSRARSYAAPAGILYDVARNSHEAINLPIE